jgi:hypothetical protein
MSQILLINNITKKEGKAEVNDVIGIFPDNHQFSSSEKIQFNIVKISDSFLLTKSNHDTSIPEIRVVRKSRTIEWTFDEPEIKHVYKSGKDWIEITDMPNHLARYEDEKFKENLSIKNNKVLFSEE